MRLKERLKERRAPLVVSVIFVVIGMLHSFFWLSLTQSGYWSHFWFAPSDIWSTYRTAHWISWGAYANLYDASSGYLTTPGMALLLAPVARLTQVLHLSEGFFLPLQHPTAWLVLGPVEMILGCMPLFAFDKLASRLGATRSRRWLMCVVQGVILIPLTVLWGHPEDAIAIAFAAYALVAMLDGKWKRVGWLLGVGIAFQPLVILVVPMAVGRAGWNKAFAVLGRAVTPAALLLAIPLVHDPRRTWTAVVEQPGQLVFTHITPWTVFAPRMHGGFISGGPTRLVAVAGACAIGLVLGRRLGASSFVWFAAFCLGLRFLTDSGLLAYYLWPALSLFVVVSSTRSWTRFVVASSASVALTVATYQDLGPWWMWWSVAVGGLGIVSLIALARERVPGASRDPALIPVGGLDHFQMPAKSLSPSGSYSSG